MRSITQQLADAILLVVDFDGGDWREDVQAFARTCADAGVPVLPEISRSGNVDDAAHAALVSMRRKHETGYRALGYRRQRDLELF